MWLTEGEMSGKGERSKGDASILVVLVVCCYRDLQQLCAHIYVMCEYTSWD